MFYTQVAQYQNALKDAGYKNTLEYKENIPPEEEMGLSGTKKHRSRTVIWYNLLLQVVQPKEGEVLLLLLPLHADYHLLPQC